MKKHYYLSSLEEIYSSIKNRSKHLQIEIENIKFLVFPDVFPSHEFRAAHCLPKAIKEVIKKKKVLDMGCGYGMIGIYSIYNGAKKVVQADINPFAVKNAEANKRMHKFPDDKLLIYESDCFDSIPKQIFDIIIFNPPFNTKCESTEDPLRRSLCDPDFFSLKKFLRDAKSYIDSKGKILIYFSNREDIKTLEKLFDQYGYEWKLWKIFNQDQAYDNRIYLLSK